VTWRERALAVTPGGAQTRSKRHTAFPWAEPGFLTSGHGAAVWDSTGKGYIDWICGLASISLGYRYKDVDRAAKAQIDKGVSFSLPTTLEVEVAEQVCDVLGMEQVRFTKTGSEATEGAMRIARLATGNNLIVSIGYHGWHTQHDAANKEHPGVPWGVEAGIYGHEWGDPFIPWEYLAESKDSVAAVLLEVCRDEPPPEDYLRQIRQDCTDRGVLLIFDEIVTGFRWAIRGAREFFGVEPDLACYGKGMANGYPLACIVGPRAIMEHASYVSGTFGGECVSLAACGATLDVFTREPVIKSMWETGQALMDGFHLLTTDLAMTGYPCHPKIVGERAREFVALAAHHGVLFHPAGFNVSFSHTEETVTETLKACERALEVMR
jgi:glutamate-1-semialdehyde aminotransferase